MKHFKVHAKTAEVVTFNQPICSLFGVRFTSADFHNENKVFLHVLPFSNTQSAQIWKKKLDSSGFCLP